MLADLPPEDIAAAWEALCRRADEIAQPDDPRARPARLADALVEAITGVPAANDPRRRPDTPTTPTDDWQSPTTSSPGFLRRRGSEIPPPRPSEQRVARNLPSRPRRPPRAVLVTRSRSTWSCRSTGCKTSPRL
jgi:hypothetical protein